MTNNTHCTETLYKRMYLSINFEDLEYIVIKAVPNKNNDDVSMACVCRSWAAAVPALLCVCSRAERGSGLQEPCTGCPGARVAGKAVESSLWHLDTTGKDDYCGSKNGRK